MKVNAYKCDQCKAWIEEDEVTDASLTFKGRGQARYRLDLCAACVEKHEPKDVEPLPAVPARVVLPEAGDRKRHPKHSPEERAAAVREGQRLLDDEGWDLDAVANKFRTTSSSWRRWQREIGELSAFVQHSGGRRPDSAESESGL